MTLKNQFLSVFWVKVIQNDTQKPVFVCILTEKCVIGGKIDQFQYILNDTQWICVYKMVKQIKEYGTSELRYL